jgi:tetratricopeptide (TPR) repeat protein
MQAGLRRLLRPLRSVLGLIVVAAGCAGAQRGEPPAASPPPPGAQVKILLSKAEGYFYKGLYTEAVREYTSLLAANPAHAAAYRCRAAAFAALHRDAEALADYRRAVDLSPRDDDAWLGQGLFHFARGRYAEAVEDFDRAIALDPGNAVTHLYKARACDKIGKYREAGEARQSYIHCTIPREEAALGERPPVRELRALGLE